MNSKGLKRLVPAAVVVLLLAMTLWFFNKPDSPDASLPAGAMLVEVSPNDLLQRIKDRGAKATLVNVWASWCAPCIEELPLLVKLREEYKDKDFELYLYSADKPADRNQALLFLEAQKVNFTNFAKGEARMDEIEVLFPDWQGVLPISIVFDAKGEIVQKWMGTASYEEFKSIVQDALNKAE